MRVLWDVRKSAGDSVGICADGHVLDMRALRDVCESIGDSFSI
jgi:hypothetical protein